MKIKNKISIIDIITFISIIIFVKILGSYKFGLGDQTAHLPPIFRLLDDSFISNDFFVNVRETFGPRYYYNNCIAFLGKFFPLDKLFLLLTIIANFSIAIVTYFLSKKLFGESKLIILTTIALVMTINPFVLGGGGWVVTNYLKPSLLARPFAYSAIFFAISQRPSLVVFMSCIAALFHPTLGTETGVFCLAILFMGNYLKLKESKKYDFFSISGIFSQTIIFSLIFILFIVLCWILPYDRSVSSEKFIEIMTFRAWSSLLPSYFDLTAYFGLILFMFMFFLSWSYWHRETSTDNYLSKLIIIPIISVILFCLCGFLFVEIFPTRLFMTAWTFRTLYIVKWLGIIIVCGVLVLYINNKRNEVLKYFYGLIPNKIIVPLFYLVFVLLVYFVFSKSGMINPLYFFGAIILVMWFMLVNNLMVRNLLPIVSSFLLLLNVINPIIFSEIMMKNRPTISFVSNIADDGALGVAEYSKNFTEIDAIFLTPPGFGGFRMEANRAIVIDYKSIPFQDEGLLGWWQRMNDCYGDLTIGNPRIRVKEIFENYKSISSDKINSIAKKYQISYAVLYDQTETDLPVIYSDSKFKLVKIASN